MTGQAHQGGIQIDVFPLLDHSVRFSIEAEKYPLEMKYSLLRSPRELGFLIGSYIIMWT
jgi:hypothetical protein